MDVQFVHRALYLEVHHLLCKYVFTLGEQAERAETQSCDTVLKPQGRAPSYKNPPQHRGPTCILVREHVNTQGTPTGSWWQSAPSDSPDLICPVLFEVHVLYHPTDGKPDRPPPLRDQRRDRVCTLLVA